MVASGLNLHSERFPLDYFCRRYIILLYYIRDGVWVVIFRVGIYDLQKVYITLTKKYNLMSPFLSLCVTRYRE